MTISASFVDSNSIGTRPVGYIEYRKAWKGAKLRTADHELKKFNVFITCKITSTSFTVELQRQQKRISEVTLPLIDGAFIIYLETSTAIGSYGVEYLKADKCTPYQKIP